MTNSLYESYTPQWLYLTEFMDALGQADEIEKQDAVLLLIRDRLVFNGTIDEKHFRFLTGKPSIVDALWLANVSHDDVDWENSNIRAPSSSDFAGERWLLIEIATSCLRLFGARKSAKEPRRAPHRTPPEQTRTLAIIETLFAGTIPAELGFGDILQRLNDHVGTKARPIGKDTLRRALNSRNKRS